MSAGPPWPPDTTDVVAVRRDLHAHPEVGFTEVRTAARAVWALEASGWEVRTGPAVADVRGLAGLPGADELGAAAQRALAGGVPADLVQRLRDGGTAAVARLTGRRPGPVVAVRLELDALPVTESGAEDHPPARGGWASRHPGVMHACGHDGHLAIGLAAAARLADRDFAGTVVLLLQPAEEGVRGAAPMVAAGSLDGVDCVLGLHLGFGLPSGSLAVRTTDLVGTTKLRARFTGTAAHAAHAPERGRNALLAAASATVALHGLPGSAPPGTRVNVGLLHGGTATNVVAAHAELALETRARTASELVALDERVAAVLTGTAAVHGVSVTSEVTGSAVPAHTDDVVADAVAQVAAGVPGLPDVRSAAPLGASDDASLMMQAVQAAGGTAGYLLLGSGGPGAHHAADFDLDEAVLPVGVDLLTALLRSGRLGVRR